MGFSCVELHEGVLPVSSFGREEACMTEHFVELVERPTVGAPRFGWGQLEKPCPTMPGLRSPRCRAAVRPNLGAASSWRADRLAENGV